MTISWTTAELTSQIPAPFPVIGRCRIRFLKGMIHTSKWTLEIHSMLGM